jgi:hypothetical protein
MKHHHTTVPSWRRWLFVAFPPLAAVLFALALTLPALAATVYNVTYPLSFGAYNPCNAEFVVVSGNEHDSFHLTYDGNGGVHVEFHFNYQDVTGVGDQGNKYRIPVATNQTSNARVGYEETFTETFQIVAQGSAPNYFLLHQDDHFTVNPDGTVTSYHDNSSTSCNG